VAGPRVAVVGAGVMGAATARACARRGADVVLLEQFDLAHTRGSSHGDARIFRLAYPEAHYVALAAESLPRWRELEQESGERLLHTTGSLDLGLELPHGAALEEHGLGYQLLDAGELERRFGVHAPEAQAVFQPDGGVLDADRCRAAFVAGARAAGAVVHERTRVDDLDALDADVVVVTAGAWVNRFGFDLPVRVTRETVSYYDAGRGGPTLIEWTPGLGVYALFTPGRLLKVGLHHAGHEADPDAEEPPNPELVRGEAQWAAERFGLRDPQPVRSETCLYTTTPDESFVLERRGRVVVGSPCSGHGFKFAPAIGERLADLALR
jgi:monomeric sarcosine oxidase